MVQGQLFTQYFLETGICETEAWKNFESGRLEAIRANLLNIYSKFPTSGSPNEAQTEQDLIFPILKALDWKHYVTQYTAAPSGRSDVPDALLFSDEASKGKANQEASSADKFKHGLVVAENKAWQVPLDRKGSVAAARGAVPSTQILRYLSIVEVQSNRRIQWGILTNGRHWRLYYQKMLDHRLLPFLEEHFQCQRLFRQNSI